MTEVDIDDKLSWDKHIDKVAKKVASEIGGIRKIRDFVDRQTLLFVYNALINPHFVYCRLQKLQNRAARVII